MADWLTPDDSELDNLLEAAWTDAPEGVALRVFLAAAKTQCIAYAPTLAEGAPVPDDWRLAQVMQARNIYNAGAAPTGEGMADGSGYGISAYPLDWFVKQLLRPQAGKLAIW